MALDHKWDVKNGFVYVLTFFSLISDGLGSVYLNIVGSGNSLISCSCYIPKTIELIQLALGLLNGLHLMQLSLEPHVQSFGYLSLVTSTVIRLVNVLVTSGISCRHIRLVPNGLQLLFDDFKGQLNSE